MTDHARTDFTSIVIKGVFSVVVTGIFVFLMAGDWKFWPGWVFVAITAVRFIAGVLIFRDRPELIQERTKPGPGTVWWDKVFYGFYLSFFLGILVVGCLDSGRYHWTGPLSAGWILAGACMHVLSHMLVIWAMYVNDYFSSTVRIQKDRGHEVVTSGPYRIVRHPGYVAAILMAFSLALLLGSWYALLPAAGVMISIVVRTALEDRKLGRELHGYQQYRAQTRFRLLPGVW
jgi:protein-S-isoprenylcysteine O-methyltransferase Ste14